MEITEIIGPGRPFEPPFKATDNGHYVIDKNYHIVARIEESEHLKQIYSDAPLYCGVYPTLAQHICDLLNREHHKKGGEQ